MNDEATTHGTTCPKCGKVVDADGRFCKYCACDLTQTEQASQEEPGLHVCPHCGGQVGDKAVFCGNCGQSIPVAAIHPSSVSDTQALSDNKEATAEQATLNGSGETLADEKGKLESNPTPTQSRSPDLSTNPTKSSQTLSPLLIVIGVVVLVIMGVIGIGAIVLLQTVSSRSTATPFVSTGLTTQRAQAALNTWVKSGSVTVLGVQEVSSENAAVSQLTFSNYNYKFRDPMFGGEDDKTYSGPGSAVFTHYTDGRWVLTKVTIGQGFDSVWWDNLNVEAR